MTFFEISLILMIPVMIFSGYAQRRISRTYAQYSSIPIKSKLTGEETAQALLRLNGIDDVSITMVSGKMTDHYDPRNRTLGLSQAVYAGSTIASVGIAAHEIGHALQHHNQNVMLRFRNQFAPVAQWGSNLSIPLIFLGFFMGWLGLAQLGVFLFATMVLFQLVTVPVEKDASRKALLMLSQGGILDDTELTGAKRVLDAAALTYIASLMVAIAHLLRLMVLVRDE